jgi:integrase
VTSSHSVSTTWRRKAYAVDRANVRQRKTGRPVRFELTEVTRQALDDYLRASGRRPGQCLSLGRRGPDQHLTTRRYARLVSQWVSGIGLDPLKYATHSMRRTKATLIYRRTGKYLLAFAVAVLFFGGGGALGGIVYWLASVSKAAR